MYAQYLVSTVLALKLFLLNSIYDQRYAEPSDVEEYVRINNLS